MDAGSNETDQPRPLKSHYQLDWNPGVSPQALLEVASRLYAGNRLSCWPAIQDSVAAMRSDDVFTPGKLPDVTYIGDHLIERSKHLQDALEAGAAVVSLSGPSKSGKTVFIEKTIGKDRLLSVTGAGVDSPAVLWHRVFDLIGTPIPKGESVATGEQAGVSAKASGGIDVVTVLKAGGEVAGTQTWSSMSTKQSDQLVDLLQLLIRELGGSGYVVFIDDFHYIPAAVQAEIAIQIKEAIRHDVLFICASVPYHSDDAVRANPDLRGRLVKLDFDYWKPPELEKIARRGFAALNAKASDAYIQAIAMEAAGSPQLMQTLCLLSCFESEVRETAAQTASIASDITAISKVCGRAASTSDYSSTLEKMKDGPKARGTPRNAYRLKDGTASDIYPIIVKALSADPPELTVRYQNLVKRVHDLCEGEPPSGSSISGTCSHIAAIANASENRLIVEWDAESEVFDIRDPYLLFYMRWAG